MVVSTSITHLLKEQDLLIKEIVIIRYIHIMIQPKKLINKIKIAYYYSRLIYAEYGYLSEIYSKGSYKKQVDYWTRKIKESK